MDSIATTNTEIIVFDPLTGERIKPMALPGYYPGYSTLSQQKFWDDATRRLLRRRACGSILKSAVSTCSTAELSDADCSVGRENRPTAFSTS